MVALKVPELVQRKAHTLGANGAAWLNHVAQLVDHLAQQWAFSPNQVLHGGSESLVLSVTLHDGSLAVLKLGLPGVCDCAHEAAVLQLAQGRGYVHIFGFDQTCNALLLEQLGPQLAQAQLSTQQQLEIMCATMRAAWIKVHPAFACVTGAEKAHSLATFIESLWHELHQPCTEVTKILAQTFARERAAAFDSLTSVLVHGDVHEQNVLRSATDHTYKLIDPDGMWAEPALDVGILMRSLNTELLAADTLALGQARCAMLAQFTGIEQRAIWQWGFIERVSTGLLLLQLGLEDEGQQTLAVADVWSRARIAWNS